MRTCLRLFLGHPTRVQTLRYEIAPIQSPSFCCRDFFLSKPPFDVPLMGLPPLRAQTLAYGQMNPEQYLSIGFLPYFDDEIAPILETAPLWDFSHTEVNSTA